MAEKEHAVMELINRKKKRKRNEDRVSETRKRVLPEQGRKRLQWEHYQQHSCL